MLSRSRGNIPVLNNVIEGLYLNTRSSNNLLQQFFIPFGVTCSNFRVFIIGNKGLIIIEEARGGYKLVIASQKNKRMEYTVWTPGKESKDVDSLLKEELQVFLRL